MGIRRAWVGLMAGSCLVMAAGGDAWGQAPKSEEPIKYRRAVMTMMKWHMDRITPMVRKPAAFNREEVLRSASYIEFLSKASLEGFAPGSHEGDTKALPEIWKDWDRYKSLDDRFQAEATKLREVARAGSAAAVKAQLSETKRVCKSCHDDFKSNKP